MCIRDSAHTATLLTAAKILKAKENEFSGQVRLFFQQAEEIGQGARQFVQAGLLDGVTRVFGAHVTSHLDSGKISLTAGPQNASCDYFKIQIHGKGAHVSTPQLGVDALYIASQIVVPVSYPHLDVYKRQGEIHRPYIQLQKKSCHGHLEISP